MDVSKVRVGDRIIETDKTMRERAASDYYPTPIAVCRAALALLPTMPVAFGNNNLHIVDPGAGTGVWGQAAAERWRWAWITGYDIRDIPEPAAFNSWHANTDYLTTRPPTTVDLVIGNPPYKLAEEFARHSLDIVRPGGYVQFLLRLAFLEGKARARGLWKEHKPKRVDVLAQRPSFITEGPKAGNTDATAYAIFTFQRDYDGPTTLGWLDWRD